MNDLSESNESSTQETEQTPQSSTERTTQGAALESTGFRFGDDAPDYLRGKTAAEAIAFTQQLAQTTTQLYQQNQQLAASQQQQQAPVVPAVDPDDWLTDPASAQAALEQRIAQQFDQRLAQAAMPIVQQNAQTARHIAATGREKQVFEKWGHEVDQIMQRVPLTQQTTEMWQQAAQMVKGNHVDDLARERAQQLLASNPDVVRGSSGDSFSLDQPTADPVWDKFESSPIGQKMLKLHGKRGIREAADAMGHSLEEYADIVAGSKAEFDPENPGIIRTRGLGAT